MQNLDLLLCDDKYNNYIPCHDLMYWPDGRKAVTSLAPYTVDADAQVLCMKFKYSSSMHAGDLSCTIGIKYLCQYDCNAVDNGESIII